MHTRCAGRMRANCNYHLKFEIEKKIIEVCVCCVKAFLIVVKYSKWRK